MAHPAGCIGLVPEGEEHYPVLPYEREVGYWIGQPFWNRGLTSEALTHYIAYCRDHEGLKSLLITTDRTNMASRRVAEKCGFAQIEEFTFDGIPSIAFRLDLTAHTDQ